MLRHCRIIKPAKATSNAADAADIQRQAAQQIGGEVLCKPRDACGRIERRELRHATLPLGQEEPEIRRQPDREADCHCKERSDPRVKSPRAGAAIARAVRTWIGIASLTARNDSVGQPDEGRTPHKYGQIV